jgi:hypothetical protein
VLYEAAEGRAEPPNLTEEQRVLWRSFCTADENSDHTLSKREIINALSRTGSSKVREMVRDYLKHDLNEDGRMQWEEFLALAESYPELGDLMRSMSMDDRRNLMFDGTERHDSQSVETARDQLAYAPVRTPSSWDGQDRPHSSILAGQSAEARAVQDGAATVIQSNARGRLVRKRTAGMRFGRRRAARKRRKSRGSESGSDGEGSESGSDGDGSESGSRSGSESGSDDDEDERDGAATNIQSVHRGRQARKRAEDLRLLLKRPRVTPGARKQRDEETEQLEAELKEVYSRPTSMPSSDGL